MTRPYVREVGRLQDMDGIPVVLGVDYDTVTISAADLPVRLGQGEAEEFAQLFVSAVWQAGQQKRQLDEEIHEADGGDSMAYCGQVKGIYECTETGPHRVHLARDIGNRIVQAWDRGVSDGDG